MCWRPYCVNPVFVRIIDLISRAVLNVCSPCSLEVLLSGLESDLQQRDTNIALLKDEITALSVKPETVVDPPPSTSETEINPESEQVCINVIYACNSNNI